MLPAKCDQALTEDPSRLIEINRLSCRSGPGPRAESHAGAGEPRGIARPALGRNSRRLTMTGTSPEASVSDTKIWQLAFLPKAEAYCRATPTE